MISQPAHTSMFAEMFETGQGLAEEKVAGPLFIRGMCMCGPLKLATKRITAVSGTVVGLLALSSPDHESQCHGSKNVHPRVFAHPRTALGRQAEAELFRKPLGDDFGESVFCPASIGKKDAPHLLS